MTENFNSLMLHPIKTALDQIKTINTTRGFKQAFITILDLIQEQFISIGYGYKVDLDEITYIPAQKELKSKHISIKDLDIMLSKYEDELDKKIYQDLLDKINNPRYDGFIIEKDNDICGYFFLTYKYNEPDLDIKYVDTNNNGYLNRDYVFKKYRGKNLQEYEIYKRLEILKQKKYKTATSLLHKTNYSSINSYKKFGFKRYITCYSFRFGKLMESKLNYKIKK